MEKNSKKQVKKYIVRCDRAGVFYGEIKRIDGSTITMANVRKIWSWQGACAAEELAVNGTTMPNNCRLTVTVKEMTVLQAIQIIPCTDKAISILDSVKEWKA